MDNLIQHSQSSAGMTPEGAATWLRALTIFQTCHCGARTQFTLMNIQHPSSDQVHVQPLSQ